MSIPTLSHLPNTHMHFEHISLQLAQPMACLRANVSNGLPTEEVAVRVDAHRVGLVVVELLSDGACDGGALRSRPVRPRDVNLMEPGTYRQTHLIKYS
jgi:hypothetical protein